MALIIKKARDTLLQYMEMQGYNVDENKDISLPEITLMMEHNQLNMSISDKDGNIAEIKYHESNKALRPNQLTALIEELRTNAVDIKKIRTLVIIIDPEPNQSVLEEVKKIYAETNLYVNIFSTLQLQYNILNHVLVPLHVKLSVSDITSMCNQYNITDMAKQLPTISRFDPVSQAIGLIPGDICRITRSTSLSIQSDYYRLCVNL
jgi:DNA-directed RNA polymerase subunit H (RpoH/RPB5)/DNA-directed RNA polymerase subunit F